MSSSTPTSSAPGGTAPSATRPSTPAASTPAATSAPSAGAPLATTPTPDATGSGRKTSFFDTIKNMFVDPAGNMKLLPIISTLGLGALGAWMGSGSGIVGAIIGGLGGAAGGALGAPLIQSAVDWFSTNVLGLPPSPTSVPRNNAIPEAAPDTVVRTPQPIVQPGAPNVNTTLVTPNLDRFNQINTTNANIFTRLKDTRKQIESMPTTDPQRQVLTDRMLSNEGILQQYVSNSEAWNNAANEWNRGERNNILAAYNRAQEGLGFPPATSTSPAPIPQAPTGTINVPRPDGHLASVARRHYNANRADNSPDWENMGAREQIRTATNAVDAEIARLRPGGPGGVVLESNANSSNGRGFNRTVSIGGNLGWGASAGTNEWGVYHRASNAADCWNDCAHILNGADNNNIPVGALQHARAKAQMGMEFCDKGDVYTWGSSSPAETARVRNNFQRIIEYTEALEARQQIGGLQQQVNQSVGEYSRNTASQFPTFVTQVQGFRDNVNQMNQQVASLNQNQVRITGRGQTTDDNHRFVTIRDERNNTDLTMAAEKGADGKWRVTHTFAGAFNPANMTDANKLNPPMEVADMFTDAGVRGATPNLGGVIRQALLPMQARLGVAAAPATTVTPTGPAPSAPAPSAPTAGMILASPTTPAVSVVTPPAPGVGPR